MVPNTDLADRMAPPATRRSLSTRRKLAVAVVPILVLAAVLALWPDRSPRAMDSGGDLGPASPAGPDSGLQGAHLPRDPDPRGDRVRLPGNPHAADRETGEAEEEAEETDNWPLDGLVLDDVDSRPVPGAQVLLIPGGSLEGYFEMPAATPVLAKAETGPEGQFRILAPGGKVVSVVVRARGYTELVKGIRLAAEKRVTLRIIPSGVVRGTVTAADGSPAAAARVYAIPADAPSMLLQSPEQRVFGNGGVWESIQAVTDRSGAYEIGGLALGGVYLLRAAKEGHAASKDLEIRPTRKMPMIFRDLALGRLGGAIVRVLTPEGTPARGAKGFLDHGRSFPREIVPQAPGVFRFSNLAPGPHSLRIVTGRHPILQPEFEVVAGRTVDVTVHLEAGAGISGVVVDDMGRALPGVRVEARRPLAPKYRGLLESEGSATTDEGGRFEIGGLRPGPHALFHYPKGYDGVSGGPLDAPARQVRLLALRRARLRFHLVLPSGAKPPESIALSKSGRPMNKAIWGWESSGWSGERLAFKGGEAEIEVSPCPVVVWVRVEGFVPVRLKAEPEPGTTVDLGRVELSTGLDVSGRVVNPAGLPVPDASVSAEVGPVTTVPAVSSADGTFVLRHLPAGELSVSVAAEGYLDATLTVAVAPARTPLAVVLRRGGLLLGTVVDPRGGPVPGLDLHVFDPEAKDEEGRNDYVSTDIRGRFRSRLAAGKYVVEVWRHHDLVKKTEARLQEGKDTKLRIVLE